MNATQAGIPDDDQARTLTAADPDAPGARHISLAGDTYTLLVTGDQTGGRYCLIDMYVPHGGGPPPHRHDFEEMFTILEGEVEFTFRGGVSVVSAPTTVNVPANAPHAFRNTSGSPVRMLCVCAPAGQDEFFARVGDPVTSRTAPPPPLSEEQVAERQSRAEELAARYRTQLLALSQYRRTCDSRTDERLDPGPRRRHPTAAPTATLYRALVTALAPLSLAYLNIAHQGDEQLLAELRLLWPGTLVLNRGDSDIGRRVQDIDEGIADVASFGRPVLANPDFVERVRAGAPLNEPDPGTFYGGDEHGYTDYPTLRQRAAV